MIRSLLDWLGTQAAEIIRPIVVKAVPQVWVLTISPIRVTLLPEDNDG